VRFFTYDIRRCRAAHADRPDRCDATASIDRRADCRLPGVCPHCHRGSGIAECCAGFCPKGDSGLRPPIVASLFLMRSSTEAREGADGRDLRDLLPANHRLPPTWSSRSFPIGACRPHPLTAKRKLRPSLIGLPHRRSCPAKSLARRVTSANNAALESLLSRSTSPPLTSLLVR
jgi:hypothetical protein